MTAATGSHLSCRGPLWHSRQEFKALEEGAPGMYACMQDDVHEFRRREGRGEERGEQVFRYHSEIGDDHVVRGSIEVGNVRLLTGAPFVQAAAVLLLQYSQYMEHKAKTCSRASSRVVADMALHNEMLLDVRPYPDLISFNHFRPDC